jgi:hypothetical protein
MYIGLLLLIAGGLGAAWNANQLTAGWIVASYVVLIVVIAAMYAMGSGLYAPLRRRSTARTARRSTPRSWPAGSTTADRRRSRSSVRRVAHPGLADGPEAVLTRSRPRRRSGAVGGPRGASPR